MLGGGLGYQPCPLDDGWRCSGDAAGPGRQDLAIRPEGSATHAAEIRAANSRSALTQQHFGQLLRHQAALGARLGARVEGVPQRAAERLRALARAVPALPQALSGRNADTAPPSVSAGHDRFSDEDPRPDSNRRYRLSTTRSGARPTWTRARRWRLVPALAEGL